MTISRDKKRGFFPAKNPDRRFVKSKREIFGRKVLSAYYFNEGEGNVRELISNESLPLGGVGSYPAAWLNNKNGINFPYQSDTGDTYTAADGGNGRLF